MKQNFHLLVLFSGFMDTESLQRFCNLTPTRQMDKQVLQTLFVCLLFYKKSDAQRHSTAHCPPKNLNLKSITQRNFLTHSQSFSWSFLSQNSYRQNYGVHSQLPLHHNTKDYNPALIASFYKKSIDRFFYFQDCEQIGFVFEHVYKELIQV